MGRPFKALISRERATRAALELIDIHGLDTLTLGHVARRIGVRAPSLYHHFHDKAELLSEVARLLLVDIDLPADDGTDWDDALIQLCVATRRSILQHPNAAPLMLQFFPRHLLLAGYDHWVRHCPLRAEDWMVMIEGTEKLTFGSALFEAAYRSRGIEPMPAFPPERLPYLAQAVRSNPHDDEGLFIAALRCFLAGFSRTADRPSPTSPRRRLRQARKPRN